MIKIFYPEFYNEAMKLAVELKSYWGRSNEAINENSDCAVCVV